MRVRFDTGAEADVGKLECARHLRSGRHQQARLQRRERDRTSGGEHIAERFTGEGVHSTGNVDCEDRGVSHVGSVPGAAKPGAVSGIDDQVGRGQHDRAIDRFEHPHVHALGCKQRGRRPPIGTVVAVTCDDEHGAPVRATHHPYRCSGDGGAGPSDQYRWGLGRARIDRPHFVRRHDGDHAPSLRPPTPDRTSSVAEFTRRQRTQWRRGRCE